jgi:hypothetical protein
MKIIIEWHKETLCWTVLINHGKDTTHTCHENFKSVFDYLEKDTKEIYDYGESQIEIHTPKPEHRDTHE